MYEFLATLGIVALVMAVPITAILTAHQRKMAEFLARRQNSGLEQDALAKLSHEVAELRQIVNQQTIMLDDLNTTYRCLLDRASQTDSVQQRLSN